MEGKAIQWDLGSDQVVQVAQHQGPIKEMCYVNVGPGTSCLATGSWDKTLKFWDLRSPNAIHSVELNERCYAMAHRDCSQQGGQNMLVVATADHPPGTLLPGMQAEAQGSKESRYNVQPIFVFDMKNPAAPPVIRDSQLSYQSRCIDVFSNAQGYLVGSIEGRVDVRYEPEQFSMGPKGSQKKSFTFKCHRIDDPNGRTMSLTDPTTGLPKSEKIQDAYPVNCITVHPRQGTFATAGSDGRICFWDKDNRSSLSKIGNVSKGAPLPPITACKYSSDGTFLAYAKGYDWFQGPPAQQYNTEIYIHQATEKEVMPQPKKR